MRILFYRWKAYNQFDLIQNLEQRGHIVDEITGEMANYESDEPFALVCVSSLTVQSMTL